MRSYGQRRGALFIASRVCIGLGAPLSAGLRIFWARIVYGHTLLFEVLSLVAFLLALTGIALALFGTGWKRILAILIGVLEILMIFQLADID